MSDCSKRKIFFEAEKAALREEFEKRRLELEKRDGRSVSRREAERDFIEDGLDKFAEGFRMGFCATCGKKDDCQGG